MKGKRTEHMCMKECIKISYDGVQQAGLYICEKRLNKRNEVNI